MAFRAKLSSEQELYDYAVGALARRMRSVAELKRLLRRRLDREDELAASLIERVIGRLKEYGYLNDAKYATAYAEFRRDNEKFGPARISLDLKSRGVHREVVEQAIQRAFAAVDEEKQAREYLRRKRLTKPKDQKQAARIFRQLRGAGFQSPTVFSILKQWDVAEETLELLGAESVDNEN